MTAFFIGSAIATLMVFWDNATDYGDVDAEKVWTFGPFHVPTLITSSVIALLAIIGWAFGSPTRPFISEAWVVTLLWALPLSLLVAYLLVTIVLPLYNGAGALITGGIDLLLKKAQEQNGG